MAPVAKLKRRRSFQRGFSDGGGVNKLSLTFLCPLLMVCATGRAPACAYDDAVSNDARQKWETIKNAGRKKTGQAAMAYWFAIIPDLTKSFSELTAKGMVEANSRYYVSQFGKGDTESDFRWLITLWAFGCGPHYGNGPVDESKDRHLRTVQCQIAKQQVLQFLTNRELLDRYHRATVWHGLFYKQVSLPVRIGMTRRRIKDHKSDAYWWYARNAILIFHATGRDDLLKDADPEKLNEVFEKWFAWWKKEGMFLRARQNGLSWYLDNGEKERQEGYIPFFSGEMLPPLGVGVKRPFADSFFRVPPPRFFHELE